jgi:hypothetical protein
LQDLIIIHRLSLNLNFAAFSGVATQFNPLKSCGAFQIQSSTIHLPHLFVRTLRRTESCSSTYNQAAMSTNFKSTNE